MNTMDAQRDSEQCGVRVSCLVNFYVLHHLHRRLSSTHIITFSINDYLLHNIRR